MRGTGQFARGLARFRDRTLRPSESQGRSYTRRAASLGVLGRRWRDNQVRERVPEVQ